MDGTFLCDEHVTVALLWVSVFLLLLLLHLTPMSQAWTVRSRPATLSLSSLGWRAPSLLRDLGEVTWWPSAAPPGRWVISR